VQSAVYAYLAADTALTTLAPVYDEVPAGKTFPYIELSEFTEERNDTLGGVGRTIHVTIWVYSQQPGFKQLEAILEQLIRLLNEHTIPDVDAQWRIYSNTYETGELTRDPDGATRMLAVRAVVDVQSV
jgi:hypothetical protein